MALPKGCAQGLITGVSSHSLLHVPQILQLTSRALSVCLRSLLIKGNGPSLNQQGFLKVKYLTGFQSMKTDNIHRTDGLKDTSAQSASYGTSKPHSGSEQRCQKTSAHTLKETLELPSLERSEPTELIASSLVGGKEKHLSGYWEVAGSTSEGIELHRLVILCANMLCWMQN